MHTHTHTDTAHALLPLVLDHHGLGELVHLVKVLRAGYPDVHWLAAGNCSITPNSVLRWLLCINAKTDSTGAEQVAELDELCHPAPPYSTGEFCLKYKPSSTRKHVRLMM